MAAKRPARGGSFNAEEPFGSRPTLRHSDTPGVYLNALNVPVDENGVAMNFQSVAEHDEAQWRAALQGNTMSPKDFLRAVMANPRLPLGVRIDAAKHVIGYTDRKMPLALDGGAGPDGEPKPLFSPQALATTPTSELIAMRDALRKLGAGI